MHLGSAAIAIDIPELFRLHTSTAPPTLFQVARKMRTNHDIILRIAAVCPPHERTTLMRLNKRLHESVGPLLYRRLEIRSHTALEAFAAMVKGALESNNGKLLYSYRENICSLWGVGAALETRGWNKL